MIKKAFVALAALAFATTTATAAGNGALIGNDGVNINRAVGGTYLVGPPTRKNYIFNNIGRKYPLGTYNSVLSRSIMGSGVFGSIFWVAAPFTPETNTTTNSVELALGWEGNGPNKVIVKLYDDNGGLPGNELASGAVKNAPPSGSCCAVQKVRMQVSLTAGTTYWVAAETDGADSSTWESWNYNDTEQDSLVNIAQSRDGSTWQHVNGVIPVAFAVIGARN